MLAAAMRSPAEEGNRVSSLVRPREVARGRAAGAVLRPRLRLHDQPARAPSDRQRRQLRGIGQTLILTLAVMYAWFMTVWTSNWLDGERRQVQLLLLGLMFASLLMSTSVVEAFGSPFEARDRRPRRPLRHRLPGDPARADGLRGLASSAATICTTTSSTPWSGRSAPRPIWIAGIAVDGDARLALWAAGRR